MSNVSLSSADSHPDCGTKGEDEIGCELTQEEIEQIRDECEEKEGHAMCPFTYFCIKQQWFCGKFLTFCSVKMKS